MYSHDTCFKDRVMRVSGIVYCFSQKDAEEVTVELQRRSLRAGCYHASLDHRQRSHVHQQWIDNSIHVRTPPPPTASVARYTPVCCVVCLNEM